MDPFLRLTAAQIDTLARSWNKNNSYALKKVIEASYGEIDRLTCNGFSLFHFKLDNDDCFLCLLISCKGLLDGTFAFWMELNASSVDFSKVFTVLFGYLSHRLAVSAEFGAFLYYLRFIYFILFFVQF